MVLLQFLLDLVLSLLVKSARTIRGLFIIFDKNRSLGFADRMGLAAEVALADETETTLRWGEQSILELEVEVYIAKTLLKTYNNAG